MSSDCTNSQQRNSKRQEGRQLLTCFANLGKRGLISHAALVKVDTEG